MPDTETLGTIAQVGLGLAGFSGIVIVLTSGGAALRRLESDRLGGAGGTHDGDPGTAGRG